MESLPYNLVIKNRSHRSENIWAAPTVQNMASFTINNSSLGKNNQIALVLAYLVVEKNVKILTHNIKKLLAKQKRASFRKILELGARNKLEKSGFSVQTLSQGVRGKKQYEKNIIQSFNPEVGGRQLQTICIKKVQLTLQKVVKVLQTHRTQSLLQGLACLQFEERLARDLGNDFSNGYELQSKGNNGSRISNKRKSTKGGKGQEVKQNSHCNGSEFSIQNQRLRNELLSEDFQRQQFAQKMHEILDIYQKNLLQGSTTTRGNGKKNR